MEGKEDDGEGKKSRDEPEKSERRWTPAATSLRRRCRREAQGFISGETHILFQPVRYKPLRSTRSMI